MELFLGLFYCFSAMAQELPESKVVSAVMPKGAMHLTKQQTDDNIRRNYKYSETRSERKNLYQLDGLLISFWDLSVDPASKKSPQQLQKQMLSLNRLDSTRIMHFSKIVTINGMRFLIYEYERLGTFFLRFQSDFDKNDQNISGLIQFKKPDEDKAQATLQEFLNSIRFKNM